MSKLQIQKQTFDQLAAALRIGIPSPAVGVVDFEKELNIQIIEGGIVVYEFESLDEFCTELLRKTAPVPEAAIIPKANPTG